MSTGTAWPSSLPPLYARWSDALLGAPIPAETIATCGDCIMCGKPEQAAPRERTFHPDVKCCTYMPTLPNFLVGGVLGDPQVMPHGRASLDARIDAGIGVTPLGVAESPLHELLYQRTVGGFGTARALRCPHYVDESGGLCGIWQHRNAVCATWYCVYDRGAVGRRFWRELLDLLKTLEQALSTWCVGQLDVGVEALHALYAPAGRRPHEELTAAVLDGQADAALQRRLWGPWHGREREFYLAAAQLVQALSWDDVLRIGGPTASIRARLLTHAFHALTDGSLPERLVLAPVTVTQVTPSVVRIGALGGDVRDHVDVSPALHRALHHFDGRTPTADAIFSIVFETRVGLQRWLVRRLVDCGVLVPASADADAGPPGVATTYSHARALPLLAPQPAR